LKLVRCSGRIEGLQGGLQRAAVVGSECRGASWITTFFGR
jgi:hypothetical protein